MRIGNIEIQFFYKKVSAPSEKARFAGISISRHKGEQVSRSTKGIALIIKNGRGRLSFITRKQTWVKAATYGQ